MVTGALLVGHPTHCRMQEVGAVEGLEDNKGFDSTGIQEAQINKVPGAPAPLVLGMEAVQVAVSTREWTQGPLVCV